MSTYAPLHPTFRKSGYTYCLLERVGDVALFEQKIGERVYAFEVVIVRKYDTIVIAGREVPAHEAVPSAEAWGREGWTCFPRSRADEKMAEVVEELERKAARKALEDLS